MIGGARRLSLVPLNGSDFRIADDSGVGKLAKSFAVGEGSFEDHLWEGLFSPAFVFGSGSASAPGLIRATSGLPVIRPEYLLPRNHWETHGVNSWRLLVSDTKPDRELGRFKLQPHTQSRNLIRHLSGLTNWNQQMI